MIEIKDSELKSYLDNNDIVLIDFWAPWCPPCKVLMPILEDIAKEYEGKIKVCKINIDDNPKSSTNYNIRTIPTVLLFKSGDLMNRFSGVKTKEEIKNIIDAVIME